MMDFTFKRKTIKIRILKLKKETHAERTFRRRKEKERQKIIEKNREFVLFAKPLILTYSYKYGKELNLNGKKNEKNP